jgi:transposase
MSGFIQGEDRSQATLFSERLDDYVAEDSAVCVIDVFIDELNLSSLGFKTKSNDTGRPPYNPATMLKLFVYGYLNRVQSSRRLETKAKRNVELMWLTGRLETRTHYQNELLQKQPPGRRTHPTSCFLRSG